MYRLAAPVARVARFALAARVAVRAATRARLALLVLPMAFLAACTDISDLNDAPADLGNFRLGHNIVVATKMKQAGISRPATQAEWVSSLTAAIDERFGRYEGDRLYHIGVSVEGFSIAPAGVPIVVSPKSVLVIRVTLWDDALGRKLNEQAKQMTVFETFSDKTVVGSGLTQSKEEQMKNLSQAAAKQIQNWMEENPEWFPGIGEARPAAAAATAPAPARAAPAAAPAPAAPAATPASSRARTPEVGIPQVVEIPAAAG